MKNSNTVWLVRPNSSLARSTPLTKKKGGKVKEYITPARLPKKQ